MTRALLVGLTVDKSYEDLEYSLNELENLAKVVGIFTVDKITQKSGTINKSFFIGSGKVLEIKKIIEVLDIDIVIFDTTLSPLQLRNLESNLDVEVMDRSFLILQIFSSRAKSKESILEVSLAQKVYMLPRLVGINKSLSRQGGGSFNAKGPGETKLELDRRKLTNEIELIKKELKKINIQRSTGKKKRLDNNLKTVALVGYTNAGKSSTMNSLIESLDSNKETVLEKDSLFATLDTKVKRLKKENESEFLLIDTVGFISNLPHELINSFKSTLKDSLDADLLLHVVDSVSNIENEINVTNEVLKEIGADKIERLLVLTKKDLSVIKPRISADYIFMSNKTGEGISELIESIYEHLYKDELSYTLRIPYDKSNILSKLIENNHIISKEYLDSYVEVSVILSKERYESLKEFAVTNI